ncbi:hypothetical protein [Nitrosophilus alvini]|uniref:hypothetical protein n=1 Tax=Nitrosophilus alvini TaxID=2714855 RepID=UPI00190E3CFE|nr:hypothetical protein [Nitrosophilus alvini]
MRYIYLKTEVESEKKEYKPPRFIGSMVRGTMGVALKRVVCINPSYDCEECFAIKRTKY